MSDPIALQLMRAIETRIRAILTAGGYHTNLGQNVHVGWPQRLLADEQAALPLVALHPGSDGIDSGNGANQKATRNVAVEIIANQHETDPDYMEYALFDVRRALLGLEREIARVVTTQTGEAAWDEPESSHTLVRLTIPVTIVYTDTYGG